jgi:hypothetical protein
MNQSIVRIYETPISEITNLNTVNLLQLPNGNVSSKQDIDFINIIRSQPLPNDIKVYTKSNLSIDIGDTVALLGSLCEEGSIDSAKGVITDIHEKLNDKTPNLVKSWVRYIKGMHPKLDQFISENLEYFKNPFSEIMGTNTTMYYADNSSIDLWYWSKNPKFKNNKAEWFLNPWPSPSYVRESVRQKLPSDVVELIMNAGHVMSKLSRRNIIYDALKTTADKSGTEIKQDRPINYKTAHGSALNSDWYHQNNRIMGGDKNKYFSKNDIMYKVDEGGYWVHVLINHINPLIPYDNSNAKGIILKSPLGIEETFPNSDSSKSVNIINNGQRILPVSKKVNDESLKPEEIII